MSEAVDRERRRRYAHSLVVYPDTEIRVAGTFGGSVLRVVDITSGERYQWGNSSEGWHLLNRPELSVIQERVPAGDRERRHYHSKARQFFYVLQGQAVLEVAGSRFVLGAGQGLEVPPGSPHQFMNESAAPVSFLVVSSPHSHGDRAEIL
jgi:mannose-6-phosphate isomerase-like protein (cupin superfamily)